MAWLPIKPQGLRVGLYVRLDCRWFDHPLPRSTFKLTSQREIDIIIKYRISRILYDPERSDPVPEDPSADSMQTEPAADAATDIDPEAEAEAEPETATETETDRETARVTEAEQLADESDPRNVKFGRMAEVRETRARLRNRAEEYLKDSRHCARGLSLVNAGEQSGYVLVEGLTERLLQAGEFVQPGLVFTGSQYSSGTAPEAATESMTAGAMAVMFARQSGFDARQRRHLVLGAELHAVGMQRLLPSQRHETDASATLPGEALRAYPALGAEMLRRLGVVPREVIEIVAQHRERLDGSGFPLGLKGDEISRSARAIGVIRLYQALTSESHAPHGLSPAEAVRLLYAEHRDALGVDVVEPFIATLTIYPPGSFVELTDDSVAFVVSVSLENRLLPTVMILDHLEGSTEGEIVDLALEGDPQVRRILERDALPPAAARFALGHVRGLTIDGSLPDPEQELTEGASLPADE